MSLVECSDWDKVTRYVAGVEQLLRPVRLEHADHPASLLPRRRVGTLAVRGTAGKNTNSFAVGCASEFHKLAWTEEAPHSVALDWRQVVTPADGFEQSMWVFWYAKAGFEDPPDPVQREY